MTDMSWEHADEARAALNAIVTDPEHGAAALSSPQTMSNLLKDLLPDAPREKGLLVAAAEAGLANTLRDHVAQGMDPATATRLAASSLAVSTPFTPEACNWVTGELAIALGISQPSDSAGGGGASQAGAAATGYSAGEAPTRDWARPSPDSYGQGSAQGYGQAAGQGYGQASAQSYGQAPAPDYGQAPVQSNPQGAQGGYQSNPQGGYQSNPPGGYQSNPPGGYQSNPQGGYQGSPQAGFQSDPQGGFQSSPQAGFQGGMQSFPQGPGAGFQQPPAPGFPQGPMPGFQPGGGPKNNSLAIAALICGCAQFVLWFLLLVPGFLAALAALVLGLIAQRQIAARGEAGRGLAITGIILGVLGILGGIAWIIIFAVAAKSPNYGQY